MRGFLGGVVIGGVVVAAGIVALSLMSPVAPVPEVRSEAPQGGTAAAVDSGSGVAVEARDPQVVEVVPAAPSALAAPKDPSKHTDTATAAQPQVTGAPDSPSGPGQAAPAPDVTVAGDSAVTAPAPAGSPVAPAATQAPEVSGEAPARPVTADVSGPGAAPADGGSAPVVTGTVEPAPATNGGAAVVAAPAGDPAPSIAADSAAPPDTVTGDPAASAGNTAETAVPAVTAALDSSPGGTAPHVAEPSGETAPNVSTEPADAPASTPAPAEAGTPATEPAVTLPQVVPAPEVAEAPDAIEAPTASDAPIAVPETDAPPAQAPESQGADPARVAVLQQTETVEGETLQPRIGKRVVPLTERDTSRASEEQQAGAPAEGDPNAPPLTRYAAAFDNPDGKPLMAIVLIDDEKSIGVEALSDFPYPLTFAVNPTAPDAAEKMARYRAAGFEVMALIDLPAAGTAQDAEVALAASFARLPEALAVLEGTGTGVQGNRPLSDQVTAFAGSTGRGIVTQGNGLNTMQKLAVRDGVPAAAVFRDFDSAGQSPAVMRRFLDQAAFRAGQEGAVVMLGRVRPDTISALLIWGLQDRATRVALAPVSAVLKASVNAE